MVHIRFGEAAAVEDEELPDAAAPPPHEQAQAASAHAAPSNTSSALRLPSCCCRVRVDSSRNNPSYVFRVMCNASADAAIASTSDNVIKAYSLASSQLTHVCDLTGHANTISDVAFTDAASAVHSSSRDGTVRGWDLRGARQTEIFTTRQELFSFAVLEHLVAAGGQGEVFFWDRRQPAMPLTTFPDTHMDEVTQVKLHGSSHVISASTDGLVAVHDVSRGVADDDDNFAAALNVGTSVEELGLYGAGAARLWARTGTETLHLWDWRVATLCDKEGGHGAFAEWSEARATAAQAAASCSVASLFEEVGFLAGCHWDAASDSLMLLAGAEGTLGFFPLAEQRGPDAAMLGATLQAPLMVLQGGHSEVVRSAHCFSASTQDPFCITGAEDGCLCLWSLNPSASAASGLALGGQAAVAAGPGGAGAFGGHGHVAAAAGAPGFREDGREGVGPSRKEGKRAGKQLRKQTPY